MISSSPPLPFILKMTSTLNSNINFLGTKISFGFSDPSYGILAIDKGRTAFWWKFGYLINDMIALKVSSGWRKKNIWNPEPHTKTKNSISLLWSIFFWNLLLATHSGIPNFFLFKLMSLETWGIREIGKFLNLLCLFLLMKLMMHHHFLNHYYILEALSYSLMHWAYYLTSPLSSWNFPHACSHTIKFDGQHIRLNW